MNPYKPTSSDTGEHQPWSLTLSSIHMLLFTAEAAAALAVGSRLISAVLILTAIVAHEWDRIHAVRRSP